MPILLFDIDGTLLDGHGVGRRSIERTFTARLGRPIDTSAVSFSGKTDRQIFREILSDPEIMETVPDDLERAVEEAAAAYHLDMDQHLPEARVTALPGAVDLVRQLESDRVPMGLLTGNLQPLAYGKVARIGLGPALFPFGAFGSDHEDRNELPTIAARRAEDALGRAVTGADLTIIGDTPRDIACARAVGATAVAVATGRYDADALADADLVLESLEAFDLAALA